MDLVLGRKQTKTLERYAALITGNGQEHYSPVNAAEIRGPA
jgi:hypothetical protein